MIRRMGSLFFIIILMITIVDTELKPKEKTMGNGRCVGVIRNITQKKRSVEYDLGEVLVSDFNKKRKFRIGDKVSCRGKEEDLNDLKIEDFDYGRYLRSKGIKRLIRAKFIRRVEEDGFYSHLGRVKIWVRDRNRHLYKEESNLLNAMLIGDRSSMTEYEKGIFKDSSTSHIMAISGLHISIIAGLVIVVLGGITSVEGLFLILVVLNTYALLVGGGPSVYRAIDLIGFFYLSRFLDLKLDLANILGIIAGVMIMENKYIIYNVSFQLSFLALLSIGIYTKYLSRLISLGIVSSTLAVSILTMPVVLYTFKSVSIMGILGNLIILPFIGVILVLDILSLVLNSHIIAEVNSTLLRICVNSLDRVGVYGANNIEIKEADMFYLLIYYIFIIVFSLGLEYYFIKKNK